MALICATKRSLDDGKVWAEPTCISMKSASRLTDQAQIPDPFKAKSFGSRSNAWDQLIELPVGGTFSSCGIISWRGKWVHGAFGVRLP
jgi:hypothetical protein